jgi:N-methylhydantoinase A/oxoprolinase/acetone carboxylase beta subunit
MCYGTGGTEPTNTDAQLVLRRLNPKTFLGGEMQIREDLAYQGIKAKIADPLGMKSVEKAAAGICKIAVFNMVNATRIVSVERGYDPTDFTLVAFGGGGPMFGVEIARGAMIPTVVVPRNAGSYRLGRVDAEFVMICPVLIENDRGDKLKNLLRSSRPGRGLLREPYSRKGILKGKITLEHYDLKYYDQSVALTLVCHQDKNIERDIVEAYLNATKRRFGYTYAPRICRRGGRKPSCFCSEDWSKPAEILKKKERQERPL